MHQKYDYLLVLSKSERGCEFVYGILPIYNDINFFVMEIGIETASWNFCFGHNIFDEASSTEFFPNSCLAAFNILICFSLGKFKKVAVGIFSHLSTFMHSLIGLFVFLQSIRILEFLLINHTS